MNRKKKERRIREKGEQNERHRNNWKRAEKRREKKIVICGRRGRPYRGISKKRQNVKHLGEWNLKWMGGQDTWDQGTAKRRNNKKTKKKENREKWTKKKKRRTKDKYGKYKSFHVAEMEIAIEVGTRKADKMERTRTLIDGRTGCDGRWKKDERTSGMRTHGNRYMWQTWTTLLGNSQERHTLEGQTLGTNGPKNGWEKKRKEEREK